MVHRPQLAMEEKKAAEIWARGGRNAGLCEDLRSCVPGADKQSCGLNPGVQGRAVGPGSALTSYVTAKDPTHLSLSFLTSKMNVQIRILPPPCLEERKQS